MRLAATAQLSYKHGLKIKVVSENDIPYLVSAHDVHSDVCFSHGGGAQHQNAWHTSIWMTVFLTAGSAQGTDTLTHIIHRAAHVGNSIFIIRLGEVLPNSTQSRETKTREGGGGGLSGNKAEVSFLLTTCELKEEHKEKCSLCCWISPSVTAGVIILQYHITSSDHN